MHDFHRLHIWQGAKDMSIAIDGVVRKFPVQDTCLSDQLRRAAISIHSNIAEGCGAATPGEFRRYLGIAAASASEVQDYLDTAQRLRYGPVPQIRALINRARVVHRMIDAFRATIT